jgi:hypothetical protein
MGRAPYWSTLHAFFAAPQYSHLCSFGCVAFVLLQPSERIKLSAQSVQCVFLCYDSERKGYHCWDPDAHRIRVSRDVTFDESRPFFSDGHSSHESVEFLDLISPSSDSLPIVPPLLPLPVTPSSPPLSPLPPPSTTADGISPCTVGLCSPLHGGYQENILD